MTSKKLYFVLLTCLCLIFAGSSAAAKVRVGVEPYLGYSQFTFDSGTASDSKYGTVLGGKGGMVLKDKLFLGLDYHLGGPYLLENNEDNEYLNRMWGVGLAVLAKKFRFWFGYYYSVEIDDIARGFIFQGTATKFSIGHEFRSKLSLNLEYCMQNYKKLKSQPDFVFSFDVNVLFVSISAPLFLN